MWTLILIYSLAGTPDYGIVFDDKLQCEAAKQEVYQKYPKSIGTLDCTLKI